MVKNNVVATEASPVLSQVIFHQDDPVFSPSFPTNYAYRADPLAGAGTSTAAQAPINTAPPQSTIPTANGGGKSSSKRTRPTDGLGAESEISADHDSDVTLAASSIMSGFDMDYSGLRKNSPERLDNCPEITEHLNDLE